MDVIFGRHVRGVSRNRRNIRRKRNYDGRSSTYIDLWFSAAMENGTKQTKESFQGTVSSRLQLQHSLHSMVVQGCSSSERRRQRVSMGKRTRAWRLPKRIRRVQGRFRRVFMGPFRALQELHQRASTETRTATGTRTLNLCFDAREISTTLPASTLRNFAIIVFSREKTIVERELSW